MTVQIKKLHPDAKMPVYTTPLSAGADLCAYLDKNEYPFEEIWLYPGQRMLVKTSLAFEIAPGYEVQIRPRSGLALKNGITVLNSPGTIDADYRGEIGVILYNAGDKTYIVKHGERIAQMVVAQVVRPYLAFHEVDELSATQRGEGGYGSTGV